MPLAYEREKARFGLVRGFSATAGQFVEFKVDRTSGEVNWRETVVCPITRLSNRVRAAFHVFALECQPSRDARIYITEQTTPFYRFMRGQFPRTVGSEHQPKLPRGAVSWRGLRNEDLTALTFQSRSLDTILTFDVLEHVPDYVAALRECARVLKPGGRIYITVPFAGTAETIVRARLAGGEIEHLLPPEHHGDPFGSGAILCFYHFGYSLLDDMRAAGFSDAYACHYWSAEFGYLGVLQMMIVGVR
jgi:SAM-dependent methyltransferase